MTIGLSGGKRRSREPAQDPDEAFAAASAEFQPKEVSDLTIAIGLHWPPGS
jgi:hypothetical protein